MADKAEDPSCFLITASSGLVLRREVVNDGVMGAVIEVRTYRAKPGMRDPLLDLLRSRIFPLQRRLGMKILGPFPSREDDVTFVWLRGFPDEASRKPLRAAFYQGPDWLGGLEALVQPMLDDHVAAVMEDSGELWSRWPADPVSGADG